MTFYQELQLNQAGSKAIIRDSQTRREKIYHTAVYLFKIAITLIFCVFFVTAYSLIFGSDNSVVGVVVLLCLMVFRFADFGVRLKDSLGILALVFALMIIAPHAANSLGPIPGFFINAGALLLIMLLGCHNPAMANHSTLVLGYLLLYGYDVSGHSFALRIPALALGGLLTIIVFYRNHKKSVSTKTFRALLSEFHLSTNRSKWQLALMLCVPIVICIVEMAGIPRAMWAGIAAMSATIPFISDMKLRVRDRIIGNIFGGCCFLALYFLLPASIYAYVGVLGGIGVGFSAKYGWQSLFNTFGALAIAAQSFGLGQAVSLRIATNIFGAVFALIFCHLFHRLVSHFFVPCEISNAARS